MKASHLILSVVAGLTLFSAKSFAVADACKLEEIAIPAGVTMTEAEITNYRNRLHMECAWKQNNDHFRQSLNSLYQIDSERVSEYQAMRFIRRVDFETNKTNNVPVELIYQTKKSQYSLPNDQKSPVIWRNWILGMQKLPEEKQNLLAGRAFDVARLTQIHIGFFQLSEETGDFAVTPYPGKMKSPAMQDDYWWDFRTDAEAAEAKTVVDQINRHYDALGLLQHYNEPYLNKLLDVRQTVKRQSDPAKQGVIEYVQAIFSGQSRANQANLQNILNFINNMVQQGINDQHMVWRGRLMSPAEVAYLAQKFYVAIHPFHEGNGRTSRFIQELILSTLNMPYGSSGDLMDSDVLTTFSNYYVQAMAANNKLMRTMNLCLDEYASLQQTNPTQAQGLLNYSCRILKD
ncbi:MAG: Fic family protein [Bdellovibrionaceae bacterium]|nr:Fic family protein [Pseudobdellovibrionaceae bacterium]